jgi:hypothetical protein
MNKKDILILMPKLNDSGQVLLIVTIALATLLGVGLSVSNQTLSSISRTSQTDSLQKVTAAAEGGLEKYLLLTDSVLLSRVANSNLVENFNASNTRARIAVENVFPGDTGIIYPELAPGQVANFFFSNDLSNQNLSNQIFSGQKTCLKISTQPTSPSFMLNVVVKNPAVSIFQPTTPATIENYDATTSNQYLMEKYIYSNGSFEGVSPESCGTDTNSYRFTNAALLRIHPLSQTLNNLKIEIVDSDIGNLSQVRQGFKITSTGEFISGSDATTRKIVATKFLDAPSYVFDYTGFIDY